MCSVDAIKERVGDDSEADASDDEEYDESEEEVPHKKKPSQSISARKILKPKRKASPTPKKESSTKIKSQSP